MKKIIYSAMYILLFLCSCGEQEVATFDVFGEETFIRFIDNASNLEVVIDDQGVVEIPVSVSTFSESERTITVEVLSFPEGTPDVAQPNQYSFNGTVTIPPKELEGILVVTGLDNGIEEGQNLKLQLRIVGASFNNFSIAEGVHTVNIFQICPIPEDYLVGTYILTSPLANIFCSADRPSFIGDGVAVEVLIGESPTQRVFRAKYAPGSCEGFNGPHDFVISLACGTASLGQPVDTQVACSAAALITIVDDPNRPTMYTTDDDSEITINVIDDINGSCTECCGAPFANQSFTLTKQ
ncbi:hypothetical protein [uncultured Croceitalea sp.]|uniref:hypothetical protein n=1 Tax=uncultured Croceitalea sp. TaxID=1798908 RepID=UPI00374F8CD9